MLATSRADPAAHVRDAQIASAALAGGVVLLALIAAALGPLGAPLEPIAGGLDAVALAAAALTLLGGAASFVLPKLAFPLTAADPEPKRLAAFRAQRLLAAALCEGPALLWCVALLLGGNRWYLLAIGALLALMAYHFPTREALHDDTGLRAGER
jgi:hypothetical protein